MAAAAIGAHGLAADPRAFEQQRQRIGKELGFSCAGRRTERGQMVTLLGLVPLNHLMGGMTLALQFDGGIGEIAAGGLAVQTLRSHLHPGVQLGAWIAGMRRLKIAPDGAGLFGGAAQRLADEFVLRAEVPVERHLVGQSRVGDGIDANATDAVLAEKLRSGRDDTLPRRDTIFWNGYGDFIRSF